MLTYQKHKKFANGLVYALHTEDGLPIETTDTFLPEYTRLAIGRHSNEVLDTNDYGSRAERWMIGVSVMSGCPVRCKFCATGQLKKYRNLTAAEIFEQYTFIACQNEEVFADAKEHKINYTRMGEPFLNLANVREAIKLIEADAPGTHHYVSTIGIKGSDFTWIDGNITLQVSLHSCITGRRDDLIPFKNKMSIEELGQIRTTSQLKTTLNMTLVDELDFNIDVLKRYFPKENFFIKLSPINTNCISEANGLGAGFMAQ